MKGNKIAAYHRLITDILGKVMILPTILQWSNNFTSSNTIWFLLIVPENHGSSSKKKTHTHTNKQNPIPSPLAEVIACFELEIFTFELQPPLATLVKASKGCLGGRVHNRR